MPSAASSPSLPPSLSIHGVEKHVRGAKVRGNYLSKRFVSFRSATGFHATTSSSSSSSSSNFDLRTAYSILFDANMRERKAVVVTILLKFLPFPAMRARSKLHYLEASRRNNNRDRESPRFFSTPRIGGAA